MRDPLKASGDLRAAAHGPGPGFGGRGSCRSVHGATGKDRLEVGSLENGVQLGIEIGTDGRSHPRLHRFRDRTETQHELPEKRLGLALNLAPCLGGSVRCDNRRGV